MRRQLLAGLWRLGEPLGSVPMWAAVGMLLGVLPVVTDWLIGWYTSWLVTPFLVLPLLLAAVVRDSTARGVALLGGMILAHSVATIALAVVAPEYWAQLFPEGAAYWDKTRRWVVTGQSEEYQIGWWLPAQFQLFFAVVAYTYVSFGLIPLWQGLFEVDLMNCYVSRLLINANDPVAALAVGWHPWSLSRGVGFLILTVELTSFSLERLTGTPLSTRRKRLTRWLAAGVFLVGDLVIKYFSLEPVRQVLENSLATL
jgi:hypothetical protein